MKSVKYLYSKINSIVYSMLALISISMSVPNLIGFINNHDTTNWLLILMADFLFLLGLVYIIIKYLIPALQNKTALEINSIGIISYIKDVTIGWKDIKDIDILTSKSSSSLYIKFKWETDHGNSIRIGLQFVKGDDDEIYKTVLAYFK